MNKDLQDFFKYISIGFIIASIGVVIAIIGAILIN